MAQRLMTPDSRKPPYLSNAASGSFLTISWYLRKHTLLSIMSSRQVSSCKKCLCQCSKGLPSKKEWPPNDSVALPQIKFKPPNNHDLTDLTTSPNDLPRVALFQSCHRFFVLTSSNSSRCPGEECFREVIHSPGCWDASSNQGCWHNNIGVLIHSVG